MNITGKVALVQINILDDINVFCDKKYDDSTIKNEYGDYLTCGEGKFYEVENGDEITQYLLGIKYHNIPCASQINRLDQRSFKINRKYT